MDYSVGVLYFKFKMTAILSKHIQYDNFQRWLCDYLNDLLDLGYLGFYFLFYSEFLHRLRISSFCHILA